MESLDCFVLGDRVLWLGRRRSARLSGSEDCLGSEDIFLEEAPMDEFFQILSEDPIMNGLVPFTIMVEVVLFCSEM